MSARKSPLKATNKRNTRKILPKSTRAKRDEALMAATIAGEYWEWSNGPSSYGDLKNKPNNQRMYLYRKLPDWNKLEDIHRLYIAHEYLISNPELRALQFSLNLSESTEKRIQEKGIEYARDQVRKAFKRVLSDTPILFWMTDEFTPKSQRLHFHGCIGTPRSLPAQETIKRLTAALQNSPLSRKRKEHGPNKVAHVSEKYERNKQLICVDSGLVSYALKRSGRLKVANGKVKNTRLAISQELRSATGDGYTALRGKLTLKQLKELS